MNIKKILLIGLINILAINLLFAQGDRKLNINEFLVFNETNYIDDYGNHSSWIEVFNPAYNSVNISKMFITNDPENPTKYRIPDVGSVSMLEPRSFIIFYADSLPNRGVFHLNFKLKEEGYIAIYDSDGRTLLDEVYYPKQKLDKTYGRIVDGDGEFDYLKKSTPNSSNVTEFFETAGERFGRLDPSGLALTIVSMTIVFSALILLFFIYNFMGILNQKKFVIRSKKKSKEEDIEKNDVQEIVLSGDVNASIALALHLYLNATFNDKNKKITIKKVSKAYSPWSSKIYGLRRMPYKK